MNAKTKGAICDLAIAAEFLMTAIRELTVTEDVKSPQVQQHLDYVKRKVRPLLENPH